jgi:hypothetical protein
MYNRIEYYKTVQPDLRYYLTLLQYF